MTTLDCEETSTCPRCQATVFWTYSSPPRQTIDDDPTDSYCGPCQEATHFFAELRYWRACGRENFREHREYLRERAAAIVTTVGIAQW